MNYFGKLVTIKLHTLTRKTKIILSILVVLAVLMLIAVNFINSEVYSLKYGNPIRQVYLKNITVKAEIMQTPEKIVSGLAGRPSLAFGKGMLFVMPQDKLQQFWMRGMRFSIDIIWIDKWKIIGCERNISADDPRIFTSPGFAGMVLEVPAGFCDQTGVQLNDKVGLQGGWSQ